MKCFLKQAITIALVPCLTALTATSFAQTNAFTPAQKTQIEEVVHQYLISKPEVILEAMQVLQNKQFEQAKKSVQQTEKDAPRFAKPLFHTAEDPVAGNTKGKITLVEFFDYQCPHCVDMAPVMEAIIKANPDLRIVFKEWPIRGPMSDYASRAALAANKQGKYIELSRAMLTAGKPLTEDMILTLAKTNGLDVEKLKKDMQDPSIENQLKANMKLAQDLKLFGTPAFFIGKTDATTGSIVYVPGQMSQTQLQEAIDKAGK